MSTCQTPNLTFSTANGPTGDQGASVVVTMADKGPASCALYGYATVTLDTGQGSTTADRNRTPSSAVTLAPGSSTSFAIWYSNSSSLPLQQSKVVDTTVTLPAETHATTLSWPGTGVVFPQGTDSPA